MENAYGMKGPTGNKHMKKLVDVYTATTGGFGADLLPPGYGYNKNYQYKVNLGTCGVDFSIMNWCVKNCKSKWGWHFVCKENNDVHELNDYENMSAVLTFKMKQDAVYFMLTHDRQDT